MTKDEFITARTNIMSEMLDHPNEIGIYQTTKAFAALDDLYDAMNVHAYGKSGAQKLLAEKNNEKRS